MKRSVQVYIIFLLFRMGALKILTTMTQVMMKRTLEIMRLKFLRMRVIKQRKKSRR